MGRRELSSVVGSFAHQKREKPSLERNTRSAIYFHEGEQINEAAFRQLNPRRGGGQLRSARSTGNQEEVRSKMNFHPVKSERQNSTRAGDGKRSAMSQNSVLCWIAYRG
jgi:hypothetical protein